MDCKDWNEAEIFLKGTTFHHTATAQGYVSRKLACRVEPYNGKFGNGYAVYTPRRDSTRYCYVSYYIEQEG